MSNWNAERISCDTDATDTLLTRASSYFFFLWLNHSIYCSIKWASLPHISHLLLSSVTGKSIHLHLLVSLVQWITHLHRLVRVRGKLKRLFRQKHVSNRVQLKDCKRWFVDSIDVRRQNATLEKSVHQKLQTISCRQAFSNCKNSECVCGFPKHSRYSIFPCWVVTVMFKIFL